MIDSFQKKKLNSMKNKKNSLKKNRFSKVGKAFRNCKIIYFHFSFRKI